VSFALGPNPEPGELPNWVLRPPRACYGQAQCGFVKLTLDLGSKRVEKLASTTFVSLELGELDEPTGRRTVTAELRTDDGEPFKLGNGKPVVAEASFGLEDALGCQAGASGSSGTGGAAGAEEATR
jgi:hypothetical protein